MSQKGQVKRKGRLHTDIQVFPFNLTRSQKGKLQVGDMVEELQEGYSKEEIEEMEIEDLEIGPFKTPKPQNKKQQIKGRQKRVMAEPEKPKRKRKRKEKMVEEDDDDEDEEDEEVDNEQEEEIKDKRKGKRKVQEDEDEDLFGGEEEETDPDWNPSGGGGVGRGRKKFLSQLDSSSSSSLSSSPSPSDRNGYHKAFSKHKTPKDVKYIMEIYASHWNVLAKCCEGLSILCSIQGGNHLEEMLENKLQENILGALTSFPDQPAMVEYAFAALAKLAKAESFKDHYLFQTIEPLKKAFASYPSHVGVLEKSIEFIRNMGTIDENRRSLFAENLIERILEAMSSHPFQACVQNKGCGAIFVLAENYEIAEFLNQREAGKYIAAAVRNHPHDKRILKSALAACYNLCIHEKDKPLLVNQSLHKVVASVIFVESDPAILHYGEAFFEELKQDATLKEFVENFLIAGTVPEEKYLETAGNFEEFVSN